MDKLTLIMKHIFILLFCCIGVNAADDFIIQRLEALSQRVDLLESREIVHLEKINYLESRDQLQQAMIDKLVKKIDEQSSLIELMEETQQAISIELETERLQIQSMVRMMKTDSINTALEDDAKTGDKTKVYTSMSNSRKERSVNGIRQAEIEPPVAFYATIGNHHFEHAGVNQVIIYDSVVTNVGNGYNDKLGSFTAPIDGIYVFSSTMVALGRRNAHSSFFKNGDRVNVMFASGVESAFDTSSSTVILQLIKGDLITVRNGDADTSIHGFDHSSFSGFLLSVFSNQTTIIGK